MGMLSPTFCCTCPVLFARSDGGSDSKAGAKVDEGLRGGVDNKVSKSLVT